MKRKICWSAAFAASLLPMLLHQYGGARGVQEISGLINLLNPIAVVSAVLFVLGVWAPRQGPAARLALGGVGAWGIVAAEVYTFLTWHIETITGAFSLQSSVRLAFPEFYVGLAVSIGFAAAYVALGAQAAARARAQAA